MKEWIKVEDQLPEENQKIMIRVRYTFEDEKPSLSSYASVYDNPKNPFWTGEMNDSRITHWKPISSKTCKGCIYDEENCTCPRDCVRDEKGWYSEYKNIVKKEV